MLWIRIPEARQPPQCTDLGQSSRASQVIRWNLWIPWFCSARQTCIFCTSSIKKQRRSYILARDLSKNFCKFRAMWLSRNRMTLHCWPIGDKQWPGVRKKSVYSIKDMSMQHARHSQPDKTHAHGPLSEADHVKPLGNTIGQNYQVARLTLAHRRTHASIFSKLLSPEQLVSEKCKGLVTNMTQLAMHVYCAPC